MSRLGGIFRHSSHLDPLKSGTTEPDQAQHAWRPTVRFRSRSLLVLLALWMGVVLGRLVMLQVVQHDFYVTKARQQQKAKVPLEAMRGDILDRHGQLLAYSVDADGIEADPSQIKNPIATAAQLCDALADCTPADRADFARRFAADTQWTSVRSPRSLSPDQLSRVRGLNLKGIIFRSATRRYYPRYELAAHTLGFVNANNHGAAGIELALDRTLGGKDGVAVADRDGHQNRLRSRVETPPEPGASLELTLDLDIQYIVERELKAGVEENRAVGGTAIVADPQTGEILGMASYPTFNPNAVGKAGSGDLFNRAIQGIYEPGSTFKVVTASAALQEGVVKPSDLIDTGPGYMTIPGRRKRIEDTHAHGVISFEDVIVLSSNVGAIKVGLRTGSERMAKYVEQFGFGSRSLLELPGEARGQWNPRNLGDSGLASVSMGYQIGVTPIQMVAAFSTVANGGLLIKPHIVRAVVKDGVRQAVEPKVLRRVISEDTAVKLRTMMQGVVERGTATMAKIEGYGIAGKTGTANKIENGAYSPTDFNASFAAFVPADRPVYTILVVIDTPRAGSHFGGIVAAPIFRRIAEAVMQYHGVPSSANPLPPIQVPAGTPLLQRASLVTRPIEPVHAGGRTVMPDLSGLTAREASRVLAQLGLSIRIAGSGFVQRQRPEAGTPVLAGGWGEIELGRTPPAPADTAGSW